LVPPRVHVLGYFVSIMIPPPPSSTLFPYTTLFRSRCLRVLRRGGHRGRRARRQAVSGGHRRTGGPAQPVGRRTHGPTRRGTYRQDRKSTRLNSSHVSISYAVFCLKKKI